MRWHSLTCCLIFSALATSTAAQVHRCKDASGKTIYSDAPCASGHTGTMIERQKSQEAIYEERMRTEEANERKQLRRERETALQPTQQDDGRFKDPPRPVSSTRNYSPHECNAAKRDLEIASGGIYRSDDEKQQKVYAAKMKVSAACGTSEPSTDGLAPRPKARTQPPPPSIITHCDSGFCYDNMGGVHHKAGPNFMTGPNGRTRHRAGDMWNCN